MARRRHRPEQIITKLREAEVALAQGRSVAQVCKALGVTEQTYYRWHALMEQAGLRTETWRYPMHAGGREASLLVGALDLGRSSCSSRACIADRLGVSTLQPRSTDLV